MSRFAGMDRSFLSVCGDSVVFVGFLAMTTVYPLWNDIAGRKGEHTKASYIFATGRVSMLPMMFSIARGTLSVRSILGYPSEQFYRGAALWETIYGFISAYPVVCFVFVPVYCNLGITSVYQYLDLRFNNKLVKRIASVSFILRNCLSMGINQYIPCVALNTIANVPYWLSLSLMLVLSIVFTFLGGLKAAITADAIQGSVLILVSALISIQGAYETGTVKDVYEINKKNGRLDFFNFTGDITTRADTVSAWLGQLFIYACVLGCEQNMVQRYLSMSSVKQVRKTLMANIPLTLILFPLPWLAGMAIYSTYFRCDPLKAGFIDKIDGIVPFFVNDKLTYIPGFLGLFLATLLNGSLCVTVSNLNSLATCTFEDFLCRLPRFKHSDDKAQLNAIKYVAVVYAFIVTMIAYITGFLPGVMESALITSSATTGPLIGVFLLAMLVPVANGLGASIGMIAAHVATLTVICGSYTIQTPALNPLSTSIEACTNSTFSPWLAPLSSSARPIYASASNKNNNDDDDDGAHSELQWIEKCVANCMDDGVNSSTERPLVRAIFGMSFMYYSVFGTIVTLVVGVLVSCFTKRKDENQYSLSLLHPIVRKFIQTSDSYASNDMPNNSEPQIKRNATVYIIYNDNAAVEQTAVEAKYTRNIVV